jgi:1-acyl-sn-glycerol-3-phosphate acyltransferase
MISAQPSRFWLRLLNLYLWRAKRRNFYAYRHWGAPEENARNYPVLLLPNHSSWWDGFWMYDWAKTFFPVKLAHVMMTERELRRFPKFSRMGAFSIAAHGRAVLRSLQFAGDLLAANKNNLVCVFPQGEMQSWVQPVWQFKSGIERIIRQVRRPVYIQPLLMRGYCGQEERPIVDFFVPQGWVSEEDSAADLAKYRRVMEHNRQVYQLHLQESHNWTFFWRGRQSIHKRHDGNGR